MCTSNALSVVSQENVHCFKGVLCIFFLALCQDKSLATGPLMPEMFKFTNTCTMNLFKICQIMQSSPLLLIFSVVAKHP